MSPNLQNRTPKLLSRRATSLLECVTSLAMLGVTLTLASQMIVAVDRQAGLREEKDYASLCLQNAMERVIALPWSQINSAGLSQLTLPDEAGERLSNAELTAEVNDEEATILGRRVTLTLTWSTSQPRTPLRLSLTTSVYSSRSEES